jgi:hypothetical protein
MNLNFRNKKHSPVLYMDTSMILIIVLPIVFLLFMSYLVSGSWTFKPSNLITTNSYSGLSTRGGGSKANSIVFLLLAISVGVAVILLLFAKGGGGGIAKLA